MPAVDTSEWEVTASQEYKTGVYYFLNVRHKVEREAVTVKARTDGTYLCLNAECVRLVRPLLSFLDPVDTRAGCGRAADCFKPRIETPRSRVCAVQK